MTSPSLGGRYALAGTEISVNRMGYGAMQLAGKGVFGPPERPDEALAVLRAAIEAGIDHIDTSDFYGPHVTNRLIAEALHPYPAGLTIVTKVGARRGDDASWILDRSRDNLVRSVHENLANLKLDVLDIVNLRMGEAHGPNDESIAAPFEVLAELQQQGLIRHLGLSTVSAAQIAEVRGIAPIVCVQNMYNIAHRDDDALIHQLAADGIAYVPYFPLGGFAPLQSDTLAEVARALGATSMQVALAWLLQRAPNILLIPGTSSVAHLHDNIAAAALILPDDAVVRLNGIAGPA